MIDKILGYVRDYLPVIMMLVMMLIDKYGFGHIFSAFRKDIVESMNTKTLAKSFETMKDELASVLAENKELRMELQEIREALTKVRGSKK